MADMNMGLGTGNPFLGDNPYLQNVIDLASKDMVKNYNLSTQPAYNAAMVKSGSFGNSAIDELNRNAQGQLQTSLGDLASKMRFNDYTQQQGMYQWQKNFDEGTRQYDQNFGRNIFNDAYGQNMQNLQTGIGLLGTLGGYNQQDLSNATTQQNTPLDYYTQFANLANGLGRGGQTSSTVQGSSSNPAVSALGGAQLGSSFYDWGKNNGWWGGGSGNQGISGTAGYQTTPMPTGYTPTDTGSQFWGGGFTGVGS